MITNRLIDLTFQIRNGNFEELKTLADLSDILIREKNNVLYLNGKVNTAIYPEIDPVSIFVALGFAFFGLFWIYVMPDGLERLNKRWKVEIKEQKENNRLKEILAWAKTNLDHQMTLKEFLEKKNEITKSSEC